MGIDPVDLPVSFRTFTGDGLMATAPVPWLKFRSDLDGVLQQEGTPCDFTLNKSGATFTLRGRIRYQTEDVLTGGMSQDFATVTVMANRWETASPGRAPQIGDLVAINGQRHRIEEVRNRTAGGILLTWTMRIKG